MSFCSFLCADSSLRIFIFAGQLNTEGKVGIDALLNPQNQVPETRDFFAHLHCNGKYCERDDALIDYLGRRNLTAGYDSYGEIAPKLEFGRTVRDYFKQQVLLVKTAEGKYRTGLLPTRCWTATK